MKSTEKVKTKNKILRALQLLLILTLVFTAIPAMPGEAASTKSKALSAYKKKLSASKVTVLPPGKKVTVNYYDTVTYRYSKSAAVKFAIAYIDNDNIPELILQDNRYCYGVWTYKSGKVRCVHWGDSLTDPYGYYKKKGIFEENSARTRPALCRVHDSFQDGLQSRLQEETEILCREHTCDKNLSQEEYPRKPEKIPQIMVLNKRVVSFQTSLRVLRNEGQMNHP